MRIIHRNIDTEDIWIEDNLFDDNDTQAIKNISKEISDVAKTDGAVFDDMVFQAIETITIPNDIETINFKDYIDMSSDDDIAIDTTKK